MRSAQAKEVFQKALYCYSSSGGGLGMRAFYHTAFTASLKKKNEMAVNILSREKQGNKRSPGWLCQGDDIVYQGESRLMSAGCSPPYAPGIFVHSEWS